MKSWSMLNVVLFAATSVAFTELRYAFTDFRHGLAVGVGVMWLIEMIRERRPWGSLWAASMCAVLSWQEPAASMRMASSAHFVSALAVGCVLVEAVRRWRGRSRAEVPATA